MRHVNFTVLWLNRATGRADSLGRTRKPALIEGNLPGCTARPMIDIESLDRVIAERSLSAVFQPIVSLRYAHVLGYEALIRGPKGSDLESPGRLFAAALTHGRIVELDYACREIAIRTFGRLGLDACLFLNVTPTVLTAPGVVPGRTLEYVKAAGLQPERVVIELTELTPIREYATLRDSVAHYRGMGFGIALDDLGAGYAGLRHWSELRPDYVKIDRHFVGGVDTDPVKRQFLRSIRDIAAGMRCEVVAEGIEREGELRTVQELGLECGQGFLLGHPAKDPRKLPPMVFEPGVTPTSRRPLGETAHVLIREQPPIGPDVSVEEVVERLYVDEELRALPVVVEGRPVGMVYRDHFLAFYSQRYSRELFGRKPIARFVDHEPLTVCSTTPLETLSRQITETGRRQLNEDFLIVDERGRYLGVGTAMDLLRRITELQIRYAAYANPLTQLPGNVPINEHIDRLLLEGDSFLVAYCDLDGFKPFNDSYGYAKGDEVIRFVGEILVEAVDPDLDFVGHVGGDDFVMIMRSTGWRGICEGILRRFETVASSFYADADRFRGGLVGLDRQGREQFFPFLSLSIGVVPACKGRFGSFHEVATAASEVKREAKRVDGNTLFIDRRGLDSECELARAGAES